MKPQDSFLIHQRNLYNYKGSSEPDAVLLAYSKTNNINSEAESVNKKVMFIVDWQLQAKDTKGFSEDSTDDAKMESDQHSREANNSNPDSFAEEPSAFMSGRKENYWVF
jgi:hypothetical protein